MLFRSLLKEAQKYAVRYENRQEQQKEGHAAEVPEAEPDNRMEERETAERFTVTETTDAFTEPYAVWDNETQDYYVSGDGTVPTFATPEEADAYCQRVNGDLQEKEAETIAAEPKIVTETENNAEKDDFSDIDTQAVREHLEKAGIVDGQLVDENALENDPFIRQVMGDVEALTGETEPEKSSVKVSEKEPEVDKSGASNYHITFNEAENTGKGFAPKEKFRQNVEAIRTLERIEG